jgi:hypothetical protein
MAYKVFLSHNARDAAWVKWIAENARSAGIEVYLYEHDLRPGELVADKLQSAIRESDALIVLLTGNSQFSPYVQQEVGAARALQKPVVPLVQPGIDQRSLAMLQGVDYISFDFRSPQPALAALLAHLQRAKLAKERTQALLALGALVVAALVIGSSG